MATSIGDLTFGIGVSTKGLDKSLSKIKQFVDANTKLAKSQAKGAQANLAGLAKQEKKLRDATRETGKLLKGFRELGKGGAPVRKLSSDFKVLTNALSKGKIDVITYGRAVAKFEDRINKSRAALARFQQEAGGSSKTSRLANTLRQLESASVLAVGPLSGLGARIRSLGAIFNRSNLIIAAFIGGITAAGVGMFILARAGVAATRVWEEANARFLAASGSIKIAGKQMQFVIETARGLGLRIDTSAKAFSRLTAATRGTSLEGQGVRKVFVAVSKAAAALRLSGAEVDGTFRAIEQIMSKGSVQAEELRGQLGERLPGAFRIAAESMGVTTAELGKMLKNGEVLADDFLPKFAAALEEAFSATASGNLDSMTGSLNNLANASFLFGIEFDRVFGISEKMIKMIKLLTRGLDALSPHILQVKVGLFALTVALTSLLVTTRVVAAFKALAAIFGAIKFAAVAGGFLAIGRAIGVMAAAMAAGAIPALITALPVIAALAIAAGVTWFVFGEEIKTFGQKALGVSSDLDNLAGSAIAASKDMGDGFDKVNDGIEDMRQNIANIIHVEQRGAGTTVEAIIALREAFFSLRDIEKPGIANIGEQLGLSKRAAQNITLVAAALAQYRIEGVAAMDAITDAIERQEATIDIPKELATTLKELRLETEALGGNKRSLLFFKEYTLKVMEFNAELDKSTIKGTERTQMMTEYKRALLGNITAQTDYNNKLAEERAAEAKRKSDMTKAANALVRSTKVYEKATFAVEQLDLRLKATAQGEDALRYYERVTAAVARMRRELGKDGVISEEDLVLLDRFKLGLEGLELQTGAMAAQAKSMAQAIGNSMEDAIFKVHSLKDVLEQLIVTLIKVAIRAAIIDPFVKALTGGLTGLFTGGLGGAGAAGAPGLVMGSGQAFAGHAARGGAWQVGGSGGIDSQMVSIAATPGETIRVSKKGEGGGGGINITINAPGADAGTIARVREMVARDMVPGIIRAATTNTVAAQNRPRFS